jgi:hypothetical protein
MSRACNLCGKPITLVPSAEERSRKTGYPASYFTNLFTTHSDCALRKRHQDVLDLIERGKPFNYHMEKGGLVPKAS